MLEKTHHLAVFFRLRFVASALRNWNSFRRSYRSRSFARCHAGRVLKTMDAASKIKLYPLENWHIPLKMDGFHFLNVPFSGDMLIFFVCNACFFEAVAWNPVFLQRWVGHIPCVLTSEWWSWSRIPRRDGIVFFFNGFFALDALAVLRRIEFMAIHASKSIFVWQFLISILGVSLNGGTTKTPQNDHF